MYYKVTNSTDRRVGVMSIEKTKSEKKALKWAKETSLEYTFPNQAQGNNWQSNYHKNLVEVYFCDCVDMQEIKKEHSKTKNYHGVYKESYNMNNYISYFLYKNGVLINP